MGKLLCWLGFHNWQYRGDRRERAVIDLLGFRPQLTYRQYRCSRCGWQKEELEF